MLTYFYFINFNFFFLEEHEVGVRKLHPRQCRHAVRSSNGSSSDAPCEGGDARPCSSLVRHPGQEGRQRGVQGWRLHRRELLHVALVQQALGQGVDHGDAAYGVACSGGASAAVVQEGIDFYFEARVGDGGEASFHAVEAATEGATVWGLGWVRYGWVTTRNGITSPRFATGCRRAAARSQGSATERTDSF